MKKKEAKIIKIGEGKFSREKIRRFASVALPFLAIFSIIFFLFSRFEFNPQNPYFSGEDAFYHVGMAKYIMEHGITQHFPYLYFTVLNENFVDHHFLFHLILIPFISIFGDIAGPKIFISLMVAGIFAMVYLILRHKNFRYPAIYPFMLFLLMPSDFYFRIAFIRDPAPSLFFMVVLLYLMFKRKYLAIGILAFFYVWLYNAFPFIALLVGAYAFSQFFTEKKVDWKIVAYAIGGMVLGLIINPYFPKNISFFFVQVFDTGLGAQSYTGGEWRPYDSWYWYSISMVPIFIFFGGIVISFLKNTRRDAKDMTLLIISLVILVLQWKSKRFVEYWPFWASLTGIVFCGKYIEERLTGLIKKFYDPEGLIIASILIIMLPSVLKYHNEQYTKGYDDTTTNFDIPAATEVNEYLKSKSNEGDIVFTDDWDVFPVYFFLNDKNYYLVGLDPEYMNKFDPNLYKEYADISSGRDGKDLGRIKTDFKSSWVLIANDHMNFKANLDKEPKLFENVYSNGKYFLYKVL